jgi:DnaJ family protein C protein 19
MFVLGMGLAALGVLMWAASAFSNAKIGTVKTMLAWIAALAGLSLAAMLFLTGRGMAAFSGLLLMGPLAWTWWMEGRGAGPRPGSRPGSRKATGSPMTRAEALEVLGLQDGASDSDIKAAWVRLMRVAHPDGGGSDWLASRVNQAKDVLLRR